ncbi:MAG: hypothetical protein ACFE0Q_11715 [Anaerolineae bacterium]
MPDQSPPTDEQEQRAPNPLWALGVALLIIIGFVIAIFVVVSPALAP